MKYLRFGYSATLLYLIRQLAKQLANSTIFATMGEREKEATAKTAGKKKRKFRQIRDSILFQLSFGKKTVNQIADEIGANWKTVDLHLMYLVGRGMAFEVFKSDYARIYDLTEDGRKYVAAINPALAEVVDTEKELKKIAKSEHPHHDKSDYVG